MQAEHDGPRGEEAKQMSDTAARAPQARHLTDVSTPAPRG
jgi:hypothetical protein